jgi:uncharacterized membrane protein YgaE (UPF0421/DUF939 family)
MKAIFKFNLPEEQDEYQTFIDANKMQNVLWEMNQWLRQQTKYTPEGTSEDTLNAYYECKDKLIELMNENNIEL